MGKVDKDLHSSGKYITWLVMSTEETIKETKVKEVLKVKIPPKRKIKNKAPQKLLRLVKKNM